MTDYTPRAGDTVRLTAKRVCVTYEITGPLRLDIAFPRWNVGFLAYQPDKGDTLTPIAPANADDFPVGARVRLPTGQERFEVVGWSWGPAYWIVKVERVVPDDRDMFWFTSDDLTLVPDEPEPVDDEPPVGSIVAEPGTMSAYVNEGCDVWRCIGVPAATEGWPFLRDNGYVVIRHGWGNEPAEEPAPPFPVGSTVWHKDGRGPWTVAIVTGDMSSVVNDAGESRGCFYISSLTSTPPAPEPGSLVEWENCTYVMACDGWLYICKGIVRFRWSEMPGARVLPLDGGQS